MVKREEDGADGDAATTSAAAALPPVEPPAASVLQHFSSEAAEAVAFLLIRELVETVDRPTGAREGGRPRFETDADVQWVMQIVNHAFSLPMHTTRDCESVRAAVRIYLAWLTAINAEPHAGCPPPLRQAPLPYFCQMLDALRSLFAPRPPPCTDVMIGRQAAEMRSVLTSIRLLYGRKPAAVREDCRQEMWTRILVFTMSVNETLLRKPSWPDELPAVMAADLGDVLLDAWTQAALLGRVPAASFWRRLGDFAQNWITFVPFVECWARKLLPLTVIFTQKIYGHDYCPIPIHDEKLLAAARFALQRGDTNGRALSETWHQLVNLIGNPASFLERGNTPLFLPSTHLVVPADRLCEEHALDHSLQQYVAEQAAMSFFLAVSAFAKMVDVFFGDPLVSIDFHESEELHQQWAEMNRAGGHLDESTASRSFGSQSFAHRPSNLSTTSSNQSTAGLSNHSTSGYSTTTAVTPTNGQSVHPAQESFGLSSSSTNGTSGTLTHQSLALAHNHAQAVVGMPKRAGTQVGGAHSKSASSRLSSRSIHAVSLQTDSIPGDPAGGPPAHSLRPGQHVWYSLKANKMHQIPTNARRPPTDALLEMFLPWLYAPAMMPLAPEHRKYSEDVVSQRSLSSADIDAQSSGMSADVSAVNRRSFANSTASSTDYPSPVATMRAPPPAHHHQMPPLSHAQLTDPDGIPSVDGVAAGRAQALAALCRIVCAKSSTERLSDEQLAQFLTVLHDALVERDRLLMCAVIFYTTDLFKLGLPGVEVLLPNYAMAIDLVLTESFKLRLHPSISEVDMRHACLRGMAAIIAWPTTFGTERIVPPTSNTNSRLLHGGQNNLLTAGCRYIDIRARTIKNLVHTLRNETDSMNLQLALGLCHAFCEECTRYDLNHFGFHSTPTSPDGHQPKEKPGAEHEEEEQMFVVSALKRIVSAICDNLCKPAWAAELATLLATFDCLNAIAALPKAVLFHRMELSCGSLTVSSLCRFINTQLQKSPPHHSRDLHSSVVAAFQCLEVWLCAAPMLAEMESCIATVAHTIEFGMTGGNGLTPDHFKPASQRVYDAAESLQFTLFASVGSALDGWAVVDEQSVIRKLGDDNLSLDRFQHFVVDKSTVLSLHDITHVDFVSNGLPTLVMVARSPHRAAHASLIQLRPRPLGHENKENSSPRSNRSASVANASTALNSSAVSSASTVTADPAGSAEKRGSTAEAARSRKQFEWPPGVHEPQCQLDAAMKPPTATADTRRVEDQLVAIRSRLAAGAGCAVGDRDAHNVWISSQLGALLCQLPMPDECVRKCNTIRVFLYDMGLVTRPAFGNELIALDTAACLADFHTHLHQLVDRQPAKRCETVSLFYVRADQTNATEILQNAEDLRATDSEFCTFVAQLGRARSVREPGFWTGHWQTAFAATPLPSAGAHFDDAESTNEKPLLHRLDGVDDCIWWTDAQLEVAFQLPTERSMQRNLGWANAVEQRHDDLMLQQQKSVPRRFYYNNTRVSFERSDSDDSTATVEAEIGPSVSPSHRRVHAPRLDESPFLPPIRLPYERSSSSTITSTMSARQRKAQRPPLTALLSVDVGDSPPRSARFRSAASRVIERRRQSGGTWRLQEEGEGEAEVQPVERRRRATTTSASVSPRARELQRQQSTSSGGGFDANSPCSVASGSATSPQRSPASAPPDGTHTTRRFSVFPAAVSPLPPAAQTPPPERGWSPLLRRFSNATTAHEGSPQSSPSTPNPASTSSFTLPTSAATSPTSAATNWSYLRSWWFKKRVAEGAGLPADLPPIPEPAEAPTKSASSLTLETMSEAELHALFPRMAVVAAAAAVAAAAKLPHEAEEQGYTPSSTASSLAPTSRTTSSLTGDVNGKRNSDVSASFGIPPTPHPGSTAAARTRSTSTINSDCSTRMIPPTAHAGDRQQSAGAQAVKRSADQRIVVVWLERFEDLQNFPYEHLLPATDDGARRTNGKPQRADVHLIFVHNFEAGLVRVHVESVWTKAGQAGPLVDGVVVSTAVLPGLLRQTIANIARRKAVEVDQPTASYRRRQAIGELSRKFATPLGFTEFLDRFITV